jgi:two-component system, cell cycle response regulator
LSYSNNNRVLYIYDQSRSTDVEHGDDICARGEAELKLERKKYQNIVIEISNFQCGDLAYILNLRRRTPSSSLLLLTDYVYIPLAVKLKDAAMIDKYTILPLSDEELAGLLADPDSPPWSNEQTLERRVRRLEKTAFTDELTDLWNRRFVDIFFANMHKDAIGINIDMSFMLFDIDELKHYNDKYGHQAGDQLLIDAATAMRKSFRPYDLIARIGGDEFAVILWQLPAGFSLSTENTDNRQNSNNFPSTSEQIAARLEKNIADTSIDEKITLSGSITEITNNVSRLSEILATADKKLYKAKRGGKNIILR